MSKRSKIILGLVVAVTLVTLAAVYLLSGGQERRAAPSPSPTLSVSPSPDVEHFHEEKSLESFREKQEEARNNPLLRALPHDTRYWSLSYGGLRDDKYVVRAIVYVEQGTDANRKIEQQKPYISTYLERTGQPSGTYLIDYESRQVNAEGY